MLYADRNMKYGMHNHSHVFCKIYINNLNVRIYNIV